MEFESRQDAGRKLAEYLQQEQVQVDVVMGLPRGGVILAAEVAQVLGVPLEVMVVRKLGHPRHREFAVGALAEGDVVLLDASSMERTYVRQDELDEVIAEEKDRLLEYQHKFVQRTVPELEAKAVLLVDDGIATGLTTEAAIISAQKRNARQVFVAAPVTSESAYKRLIQLADRVFVLLVDPEFEAVGSYYTHFAQTTDAEVLDLLNHHRNARQG